MVTLKIKEENLLSPVHVHVFLDKSNQEPFPHRFILNSSELFHLPSQHFELEGDLVVATSDTGVHQEVVNGQKDRPVTLGRVSEPKANRPKVRVERINGGKWQLNRGKQENVRKRHCHRNSIAADEEQSEAELPREELASKDSNFPVPGSFHNQFGVIGSDFLEYFRQSTSLPLNYLRFKIRNCYGKYLAKGVRQLRHRLFGGKEFHQHRQNEDSKVRVVRVVKYFVAQRGFGELLRFCPNSKEGQHADE